jgi:hypothetical protein
VLFHSTLAYKLRCSLMGSLEKGSPQSRLKKAGGSSSLASIFASLERLNQSPCPLHRLCGTGLELHACLARREGCLGVWPPRESKCLEKARSSSSSLLACGVYAGRVPSELDGK